MMQAKLKDAVTIMCFGSRKFKVFMRTLDKKNKKTASSCLKKTKFFLLLLMLITHAWSLGDLLVSVKLIVIRPLLEREKCVFLSQICGGGAVLWRGDGCRQLSLMGTNDPTQPGMKLIKLFESFLRVF